MQEDAAPVIADEGSSEGGGGKAFVAWPEITKFSTMLADAKTEAQGPREGGDESIGADAVAVKEILQRPGGIPYRGKIKLHGTNAESIGVSLTEDGPIPQSRTRSLIGADNEGFARWVDGVKDYFGTHVAAVKRHLGANVFVVFGEWCGKGIMRGAAICRVPDRYFCVFAVQIDNELVIDPTAIEDLVTRFTVLEETQREIAAKTVPKNLFVLPWQSELFHLPFHEEESLEARVGEMNKLVEAIDHEDPWVKQHFNISGAGEGLVWYPVGIADARGRLPAKFYARFVFKAKGEKHLVVKQAKPIQTQVQAPQGIAEFVEMFVTPGRLEQGVNSVCEDKYDKRFVGKFVVWLSADVEKESKAELAKAGLKWADVKAAVTTKAREWYLGKIPNIGLDKGK